MNDTEDDRHLHLVGVREEQLVVCAVPSRVKSERIGVPIGDSSEEGLIAALLGPRPSRMEEVSALREDIVVEEAGVDGENAHEQNDVTTAVTEVNTAPTSLDDHTHKKKVPKICRICACQCGVLMSRQRDNVLRPGRPLRASSQTLS